MDVGAAVSRPAELSWRELRGVQQDPAMSLAAKGLLHELLARPPGVVLTRAELFQTNRDGMAAIDAAIEELARAGLVVKVKPRKRSQGRASGGVRLPAPATSKPQPEPTSGAAFGARPAPAWWETWQVAAVLDDRALPPGPIKRDERG
jgi:hypothetical protein